ncbi:hypothetical protein NPX13_g3298 [Xylaria arbuscula]|uniref:Trichodiene oxygenase n=1 Tax=Xylaria arbuscula TaxID=114810 RepID=A0A9W8TND0_9PEZI|nr:hypothetical protein NPX13_g3298 [Xylaria arbuscula]
MTQINQFMAAIYWPYVVAGGVILVSTVALYRLFFHPLAMFPGPKLAAVTRGYEAYYDVVRNGQYTFKIAEMHKKYGPIVRISPYELHISDPDFYDKIYSREGEWDKYAWAYDAFGAPLSTICAIDHNVHKHRRAAVNPFFSKANVAAKSGIILRLVKQLCSRIDEFADESNVTKLSLNAAISALTRDVATEFILGKRGSVACNETSALDMVSICSTIDSAVASGKSDPDAPRTIVHQIVDSDLPKEEKSLKRICDEVGTITGAAFETTANSIRLTLYHIYNDPEVLDRLRAELNSTRQGKQEPKLSISSLEQLPYLTAVLLEGLRLSPATATRANRIASNHEIFFRGRRIPAKTPVGMTTYLMHRDPDIYPDAEKFNPQRWLDLQERWRLEKFYAPFSKGPRNCLGMHLAWAELYMTVAAIVEQFNLIFDSSALNDLTCTSDQFIIGTSGRNGLHVTARRVKE